MPREPLSSINGNTQKRKELNSNICDVILEKHQSGFGTADIAHDLQIFLFNWLKHYLVTS